MRTNHVFAGLAYLLGVFIAAGCSSTSGTAFDASTGKGGAGGAAGSTDAGGAGGAGGVTDGGLDRSTGGTGGGVDGAADRAPDASDASGPCTTSFGAGNPVLFAFNGGVNGGWYAFVPGTGDLADAGLAQELSLGASFTDGNTCPGALQFGINFTEYGMPNAHGESAATEYYFGGRDWSAYKTLHGSIKLVTTDNQEIDSVYFYVKSDANNARYQGTSATGASLSNGRWQNLSIDLTVPPSGQFNGVLATMIQLIGFEVDLKMAPAAGAPATPSLAILLVDDLWLEARPPSDAGADAASSDGSTD